MWITQSYAIFPPAKSGFSELTKKNCLLQLWVLAVGMKKIYNYQTNAQNEAVKNAADIEILNKQFKEPSGKVTKVQDSH